MEHFVKILVVTVIAIIISCLDDFKIFEYFGLERDEISDPLKDTKFLIKIFTLLCEVIAFMLIWANGREIWYCYLIPMPFVFLENWVRSFFLYIRRYLSLGCKMQMLKN